jgi:hypothetical protein
MMFRIGAVEYGPFLIDHASVDTYALTVEVPAGVLEVAVEDVNNDGPFKVSTITIQGASAPATPRARPGRVGNPCGRQRACL